MHGPWHPILHNAPRPRKDRSEDNAGPEYAKVTPNDYSWYRPLDTSRKEIRILFIEPEPPGSAKDVIVHVFNASLLDASVLKLYGCLSYCWGDASVTQTIQVMYTEKSESAKGGIVTTQRPFRVTSNLEAALRVFRSRLSRPVMWADALCIDQSDIAERSSQVALMAEIYTQAVQTIVWLGEADSTTKMVFDFADFLTTMEVKALEVDPQTTMAGIKCRRLRPLAKGELEFTEEEITSDDFYKMRWGIQTLLARPFFRRAWVLQEVGLADKEQIVMHCGQHSLWWQTFQNLTSFEWRAAARQGALPINMERNRKLDLPLNDPAMTPGANYTLPEIWSYLRRYCSNTKRAKIIDLIFRRLEVQATDPRDQVFALFGLAEECQAQPKTLPGFQADYSRDLAETFTLFTRAVIEKLQSLIVLSAANVFEPSSTRHKRGLPSWVPEYDNHINLRRTLGFLGDGCYKASGSSKPHIVQHDKQSLVLSGMMVDWVKPNSGRGPHLMEVETDNVNNLAKPAIIRLKDRSKGLRFLWQTVSEEIQTNAVEGEELLESFILTLICSRRVFFDRPLISSVKEIPNLFVDFAAYWKLHCGDFSGLPQQTTFDSSHEVLLKLAEKGHAGRFGQRLYYTCHQRAFLVTGRGLLALVPPATKAGDIIVVCEGANVPFVVRRTQQESEFSSSKMEFVGECYVHGLMLGNAMLALEEGYIKREMLHFA